MQSKWEIGSPLIFFVNGKKVVEENPKPEWTLVYFLRYKLRLCGTKEGCGEGGCGACTVMLSRLNRKNNSIENFAINACLTPLCSVHGTAIVTTEGIGSVTNGLHPVQERIAKSHGTQCGFCTPGFVMSMYTLLRNNPQPSEEDLETALQGNLCRCTGYRPIIDGFKTLCLKTRKNGCCLERSTDQGVVNERCCKANGNGNYVSEISPVDVLFDESEFKPYDPSQDPIFPPELLQRRNVENRAVETFKGTNVIWHIPKNLKELLEIKSAFPNAKIIAGNTEIGVDVKFKNHFFDRYIEISQIQELLEINLGDDNLVVGAGVTITTLLELCQKETKRPGDIFEALAHLLNVFGGKQIRNVATIGGNIITASPISDLNPVFMACGVTAKFTSQGNPDRTVRLDQGFFKSYRKTGIKENEILVSITIPLTTASEYIWTAKQARRRDDDIAIVNACMRIKFQSQTNVIEEMALSYGGMGPTTLESVKVPQYVMQRKWENTVAEEVTSILLQEFTLADDAPGGMIAYRYSLVSSFFFKFFLTVTNWITENNIVKIDASVKVTKEQMSAIQRGENIPTKSSQLFEIPLCQDTRSMKNLTGTPIVHLSGLKHATGEACYTDDTVPHVGELHIAFVLSKVAHANIISIDASASKQLPGVVEFFNSTSIPQESNDFTPDEEIFASKKVTCQGQVIGIVVAVDQPTADKGAKLVKVEYQELPPITTIEEAIQHKSFFGVERHIECGNVDEAFVICDEIIEGEVSMGGQEHFYLETQSCIAYPNEDNEMDMLVSTQAPYFTQIEVAKCLGVPANRVKIRCRRMGGAFGGKETRTVIPAFAAAIAAKKLGVPVRCIMNRQDDMNCTGGRHPFMCKYKIGFKKSGQILAVKASMYSNGGNSKEASPWVMEKALLSIDGAYDIPNWYCTGRACKTNLPSNTAFRGYGGPQASFFIEHMMDVVAESLKMDSFNLRLMHLKQEGHCTPYGFPMENCTLSRCWDECVEISDYFNRKAGVEEFNTKNSLRKRGIVLMPTRHDIGFHVGFLNQGGALVLIYTDGSVSLNHGGTEMGQGLLTKMAQVASRVLDIPLNKIYFSETSSDKIPNATATCGSMSSDLNGMAVVDACNKLVKRLEPFKKANPKGKWEDWVTAAYMNRISLSATGFYQIDNLYNFEAKEQHKRAFSYSAFGVACSEVEVDCLTGDHKAIRTDIVMDVGESLNPAVDIGQIEGAFVQGYGLFCMEEHVFSAGKMLTKGPAMYKIPSISDIPREFNVSLLRGAPNPRAVYSSKGIGEPPLFLAASIFLAIKEAVKNFRREQGLSSRFVLHSPATVERVLLACKGKEVASNS